MDLKAAFYLCLSLIAFAANSVLCRLALGSGHIDPTSFTSIRLTSGAITLAFIFWLVKTKSREAKGSYGSWLGAASLFVYAIAFSFAYISLGTGMGALVLFGCVQITMLVWSVLRGQKLRAGEVIGILMAFVGLVYLVIPSISSPSLYGFLLMSLAGIAWAVYSILGQGSHSPLSDTAFNFIRTLPISILLFFVFLANSQLSEIGIILAILSGAVASGIGYAIWYKVLPSLPSSVAAVSQLCVPIIAAGGGLIWMLEPVTLRFIIASSLVLGGIFIVINRQRKR